MKTSWATRLAPIVFVLVWSTGFIGARYGLPYAPAFGLLAVRLAIAAVVLAILTTALKSTWPTDRASYSRSALIGIMMHAGYLGGVFVSIDLGLPVAVSALIVCLQPVAVAGLSRPVLGESLAPRQWVGIALGLTGAFIVLEPGVTAHGVTSSYSAGAVAAAVFALICSTVSTLLQKKHGSSIPMLSGTSVQYAAAAAVLTVLAIAFDQRPFTWTAQLVGALVWMVFALSIGAILLMFWLLRRGTAAGVSSLYFLVPPVTLLMGWLLFGQTLAPVALVGFAVSSLGVLLVREQ